MQKPLTEKRLENICLFYLERFDASSDKLRQMLNRRIKRQKMQNIPVDKDIYSWIENVIGKMQRLGYVNDTRYAENVVRRLSQSGKSARFIQQKLAQEGINADVITALLNPQDDLERACLFVRKKRLGANYEKDLAKLARAGFDYETAKQALEQGNQNDNT